MRKLSFTDAAFLYNETLRTPMHIASVQRLRLPPGMDVATFTDALREQVRSRLHLVPYLTQRLVETPLQLDHPSFAAGHDVNLGRHIRHVHADAPGDQADLETCVARLHASLMDRNRPLWEMVVIGGLEDGKVAIYSRVHHCCIDGIAGQAATTLLYDDTQAVTTAPERKSGIEIEHPAISVVHAFENFVHSGEERWRAMPQMFQASLKVRDRLSDPTGKWNGGFGLAPSTPYNRPVGNTRAVAFDAIPLAELKAVGKTAQATLNDVVLAICGGGLRALLTADRALPQESLLAGCPVSLRRPGDTTLNNQVSMMRVALGTHLTNPQVRLLYVKEASRHARHLTLDAMGLMPASLALPGLPAAARLASFWNDWMATGDRNLPVPVNVVISNVPGPSEVLRPAGAEMESHWPVSIPAHGLGVNITVQSYAGTLFLGITSCARTLPDPGRLRDAIAGAWAELKAASLPASASVHPLPLVQEEAATNPDRRAA
jgi:WS/DGAT/MGAT family acyltransferase